MVVHAPRLPVKEEPGAHEGEKDFKIRGETKVHLAFVDLHSLQSETYPLEKLPSEKGLYLDPWGVAATPDAKRSRRIVARKYGERNDDGRRVFRHPGFQLFPKNGANL